MTVDGDDDVIDLKLCPDGTQISLVLPSSVRTGYLRSVLCILGGVTLPARFWRNRASFDGHNSRFENLTWTNRTQDLCDGRWLLVGKRNRNKAVNFDLQQGKIMLL